MSAYAYPNPQAIFYQQYEAVRRDEVVGILLALFLGVFGIHHFYLRRTGLGILYCCFFWTRHSGNPGLYRVLLHARPRARVQRHPGSGDCRQAGHCRAVVGSAAERHHQRAASGGRPAPGHGQFAHGLPSLPALQRPGRPLLHWMRSGAGSPFCSSALIGRFAATMTAGHLSRVASSSRLLRAGHSLAQPVRLPHPSRKSTQNIHKRVTQRV